MQPEQWKVIQSLLKIVSNGTISSKSHSVVAVVLDSLQGDSGISILLLGFLFLLCVDEELGEGLKREEDCSIETQIEQGSLDSLVGRYMEKWVSFDAVGQNVSRSTGIMVLRTRHFRGSSRTNITWYLPL
jgi:hypothetical protein